MYISIFVKYNNVNGMRSILNKRSEVMLMISSFFGLLFWIFATTFNVYKYKIVGAVFEILWLPMLAMLLLLPLLCVIFWKKEYWNFRTLYPACLLIHLVSVLFLVFGS